jgi:hypothetical protein
VARTEHAASRPAWARTRDAAVSVPAWGWLVALVVVSTVARWLLAREVAAPFIFQDELLYSELGKGLGTTGHFAMRGVPGLYGIGPVYPALISPAYALFASIPHAYAAVKGINALLMSLAAVPAFLIARRLVGPWLSLLAAALAIAIPDVLLAGTIMTENGFYPLFLLWVWLLVLMLERPTVPSQLGVLALLLVLYETRSQAVALAPALLTALVLMIGTETLVATERRRTLVARARSYWLTWALVAVGTVLYVLVEVVVRGQTLNNSLLKTYSALGNVDYSAHSVAKWFLYHLSELDIVTGILPLAAFVVVLVAACRRDLGSPALRAFAAAALAASFWILLVVAFFASSPYSHRLEERNSFYVMPLLLIALVVWAGRLAGRLRVATVAAAAFAAGVTAIVPLASFFNDNARTDAFGVLAFWGPQLHRGIALHSVRPIVVVAAIVVVVAWVLLPARLAVAAPVVVLVFLALVNRQANFLIKESGTASRNAGVHVAENWVDAAVGGKEGTVTFLFTNARPPQTLWVNEFFNRSIGPVYNFAGRVDGLPQATVARDRRSGVLLVAGVTPLHAQYVLTDTSQFLAGTPIAEDRNTGMRLYRVNGLVRVVGGLSGIYPDLWSGPTAGFTASGCHGGHLSMRLTGDPDLQPKPQTIVARSGGRVVGRIVVQPRHFHVPFRVPLVPQNGVCTVQFAISPTAVPAQVFGRPDYRRLGIRFQDVRYEPR